MDIAEAQVAVFYPFLVAFVGQLGISVAASVVVLHDVFYSLIFIAR